MSNVSGPTWKLQLVASEPTICYEVVLNISHELSEGCQPLTIHSSFRKEAKVRLSDVTGTCFKTIMLVCLNIIK